MMKKISDILLYIFGTGVTVCLFAGALAFLGFVVALIIGGETATELCVFIHKTYFPWVITATSLFVGFGLVGMYFSKKKALSITKENNEDEK